MTIVFHFKVKSLFLTVLQEIICFGTKIWEEKKGVKMHFIVGFGLKLVNVSMYHPYKEKKSLD